MRNRVALAAHNSRLQWRVQARDREIEHLNYEVTRVTTLNVGAIGTMAGLQDEIERLKDEATEAAVTGTGWLEDLRAEQQENARLRAENERLQEQLAASRRITIRPVAGTGAPVRPTDLPGSGSRVVPLQHRRAAA